MALDKAIQHGKEKRKPYMKYCEQVDKTCRPHGGCPHCKGNRLHNRLKKEYHAQMDIKEAKEA